LIDIIQGGFKELSQSFLGIEVLNRDDVHLKLTDVSITMDFLRIGDGAIETPPFWFNNDFEIENQEYKSVFPWLNKSTIKYYHRHKEFFSRPKYISFLNVPPNTPAQNYRYKLIKKLKEQNFNPDDIIVVYLYDSISEPLTELMGVLFLNHKDILFLLSINQEV